MQLVGMIFVQYKQLRVKKNGHSAKGGERARLGNIGAAARAVGGRVGEGKYQREET